MTRLADWQIMDAMVRKATYYGGTYVPRCMLAGMVLICFESRAQAVQFHAAAMRQGYYGRGSPCRLTHRYYIQFNRQEFK